MKELLKLCKICLLRLRPERLKEFCCLCCETRDSGCRSVDYPKTNPALSRSLSNLLHMRALPAFSDCQAPSIHPSTSLYLCLSESESVCLSGRHSHKETLFRPFPLFLSPLRKTGPIAPRPQYALLQCLNREFKMSLMN